MADSDDDVPGLDVEVEESGELGRRTAEKEKSTTIPNFKGKVPDVESNDFKASLQIQWDGDEAVKSDDDDLDEEEYQDQPEVAEGEVGEEFAKARREAARDKREKRLAEAEASDEEEVLEEEDLWNFPPDKDKWQEEDIGEEWADAWGGDERTGFDPDLVDDWEEIEKQWQQREGPPLRPWYVPYRKHYPLVPEDHPDIQTPQDVVEELDRYEEFLTWASYIFKDGSSYEGTVFDDLAHGKGVYRTALELCRYEGEWFQNAMEGHGVLDADIPLIEPPPDSEVGKKLRAQGKIQSIDFLDDDDKEWIKMDIEDKEEMGDIAIDQNPWEDDEVWVNKYGEKPEKGHYRYAGQWKHSRMHGCGLYEVNGRQLYGQFYFGELLPNKGDCDDYQVAIHSGLAEIAAAKARMFINKPDGMVREAKGPYTDPQHPYMYDEEDMWMAPGFINAFYKVPEEWGRYVEEVDEEQEMWLNSFIKSPFRIPMPPELEYQWAHDDEFIVLSNRDSNPMHQHPENLDPEAEGDILLQTTTGHLINWAEDPNGNMRFFIQPFEGDGKVRPDKVIPLPLGFDGFMGIVDDEGNVLNESGRRISSEQRRSLELEDKKKEKQEKLKARIMELKEKSEEKIKEMEMELYMKDLESQLEDYLIEDSFRAELEAVDEDVEVPEEGTEIFTGAKEENLPNAESEGGQSLTLPKQLVGDGHQAQDGGRGSDDEESSADDESEEEKKPQSFGKVAMVAPGWNKSYNHSLEELNYLSFPTIFASLSLVPQILLKPVLESSISCARRAWYLQFGISLNGNAIIGANMGSCRGGESALNFQKIAKELSNPPGSCAKVVKLKCAVPANKRRTCPFRLSHCSRTSTPGLLPSKQMPAVECLLAALKKHQISQTAMKSQKKQSQPQLLSTQLPMCSLWVLPDMEVLSVAIPVKIVNV